jgi:hypothetical protein
LPQTGIDHLHTSIAQGACHHLGTSIMPVQPGLGNQYTYHSLAHLASYRSMFENYTKELLFVSNHWLEN